LLSKIVSSATTPAADTRSWDNLPNLLGFAAVQLPPGPQPATVDFIDAAGRAIPGMTRSVTINVLAPPRDTVVFVTDRTR
jgi:hypothetical protein